MTALHTGNYLIMNPLKYCFLKSHNIGGDTMPFRRAAVGTEYKRRKVLYN